MTLTSDPEIGKAWAVAVCLGFAAVRSIKFPRVLIAMDSSVLLAFTREKITLIDFKSRPKR